MTDDIRPMRVVLGGIPALSDILGRYHERAAVLDSFHGHGALLTGDRRHGKTCLTRLVEAAAATDHCVVRISAERSSFEEFVEALADEIAGADSGFRREIENWRVSLRAGPLSVERAGRTRSLDALVRAALRAHPDQLLVLSLDEIPVLAKAMEVKDQGSGGELLHLLRRLRQEHSGRLVMVLSGSIGFHHVTDDALGAANDVVKVAVGPLAEEDAVYLARCLLLGEGVQTTDELAVGRAIATAAERVPYYVHQLVKSARDLSQRRGAAITPTDVPALVDDALTDRDDPWDLRHYRDRIPTYYGAHHEDLVAEILDAYATAPGALSVDAVGRRLDVADLETRPGRSALIRLIERLEADHYLVRVGDDSRFASDLVRRAWLAHRRR